jgi:Flp pilus assembly protein TadG
MPRILTMPQSLRPRRERPVSAATRRFAGDVRGNVAVITCLALLPLIGLTGIAIDHIVVATGKSQFDQAADAASLGAVRATAKDIQAGVSTALARTHGQQVGAQIFAANAGMAGQQPAPTPVISVDVPSNSNVVTASVAYAATGSLMFGGIFGSPTATMSGQSSASMSLPSFIDVYLMIDTSGSMAIGASSDDQTRLIQTIGCAFACHDGNPVAGYADAYTYAEATGVQLRYDVINSGIRKFFDTVDRDDPQHRYIRSSIYSFDSNLHNLTGSATPISDTAQLRNNLPAAPATSGEYDGATHFNESIGSVMADIGAGGDGLSAGSPKKLLIIATDGVEDPNRTWTYDLSLRPQVTVIDTGFCSVLSAAKVSVAFIHMAYLPMTSDWGYMATLGQPVAATFGASSPALAAGSTRVDLVKPALQACAGKLYTPANDTTALNNAFTNILQAYIGVRLTH